NLTNRGLVANPTLGHSLVVQKLARMHFEEADAAEMLVDGDATFKSVFEGIEEAKEYVLIAFYIIRKDNTRGELKRRLVEKARQGVRVYVLYDEVGSPDLIESSLTELRDARVDVR